MRFSLTKRNVSVSLFLFVGFGGILLAVTFCLLTIRLAQNVIRTIDSGAESFGEAVKATFISALKEGSSEQKLEVIQILGDMGPSAKEFVPSLTAALVDNDADVPAAALAALKKIEPNAAKEAWPEMNLL